ncbi:MAG: prepilin-type N-terminal cleavage/methylation domain-containing protein [Planctomycetes bacterium]|nr:prepilin-type N-terminal cleavage/methylation domain-containing protein [Planctomycetota bacterium]
MRTKRSGFTLVEILIVVVILGILAAIVIPQFSDASSQAKDSSLRADLQTIRSQIELYKVQHTDALPGAGTGTSFTEAMTGTTDVAGLKAGSTYGPYLQAIPTNPFNGFNTITEAAAATGSTNLTGWHWNTATGYFQADSTGHATW